MSLLVFQHEKHEDAARLGQILQGYGHRLRVIRLHEGMPIPPDMDDVDGVISMGGSANVDEAERYAWLAGEMKYLKAAHDAGLPVVGVCLGAQLIAAALGGKVAAMAQPEVGWHGLRQAFPGTIDPIYGGIRWDTMQFHLHGQEVTQLPPGATPLAGSKLCKTQAFKVGMTTYAFQYHFEWTLENIKLALTDALVQKAGANPQQILDDGRKFAEDYRRVGDRLCHTIATLLFPIDKR